MSIDTSISFVRKNDGGWNFKFIENGCDELTGVRSENIIASRRGLYRGLISEPSIREIDAQIQDQLVDSDFYKVQYVLQSLTGEFKTVSENGFANAERTELKGFLNDISSQQILLTDLTNQRMFYESTLNTMPLELVVLGPDHRYIFCNETAIKDASVRRWLIGKTDMDYVLHRGKDPSVVEVRTKYFLEALQSKKEIEWEEVQNDASGQKIYKLKRYSPVFDHSGEVKIIIGFGFDITGRRKAEEQVKENEQFLTSLNQNLNEGIFKIGLEGEIKYANDAFYKMMDGYIDTTNHLIPKVLNQLLCNPGETQYAGREIELIMLNASRHYNASSQLVVSDAWPSIDGVIVDITERKQDEQRIQEKNKELGKAYAELDKFVYSASHDLRAPLTSVLGLIQIMDHEIRLKGNTLDDELLNYVQMLQKSILKLDNFVKDIINYYKNKRFNLVSEEFDLHQLINDAFESLTYARPELELRFINNTKAKTLFTADKTRVTIIINNLVSNAVKYHTTQKGFVKINSQIFEEHLLITINDNGPGIAEKHLDKLFGMFYRASIDSKGSGLGLYIVHESVEKMNGSIWVESELGKGTTFYVKLPTKQL